MLKNFRLAKYKLVLEAKEPMLLPEYKGSMFRGGFGHTLKRVCCSIKDGDCLICMLKEKCPYAYIFETSPPESATHFGKNLAIPRPYLFEPDPERKRNYNAGEKLTFHMVLIGKAVDYLPYFIFTIKELGKIGITKRKHRYELTEILAVDELKEKSDLVYSSSNEIVQNKTLLINFDDCRKEAQQLPTENIKLKFLAPARIRYQGRYCTSNLPLVALIQSLTLRINALAVFHCGDKWDDTMRNLRESAASARVLQNSLAWFDVKRLSSRQQKTETLSGLVGSISYSGELAELLPFLVLGQFIHVGSDAVFGCGKYRIAEA